MRFPRELLKGEPAVTKQQMLVVDDDAGYLQLVGAIIEQEGGEAVFATSGEEAVDLLKEQAFAVLVTDLNMGGMNGYALAMMARELHPDIEIVMITGDASSEVCMMAATAGISQVIAKPCRADDIRRIIAETTLCQIDPAHCQG